MNVSELVRESAGRTPDKPALLFRETRWSWRELDREVDRTAAGLRALGLAPGDRLALVLPNTPSFAVCYFGALRAGLVVVPVNTSYTAPELEHVLGDSGARAVVGQRSAAATLVELAAGLPALEHVLLAEARLAPPGAQPLESVLPATGRPVDSVRGDEDLAVLIYTSGTSGRPKGAMLSHRALLANLEQCARIEPPAVREDDVVLLVLPLFHIYGLNPGLGMVARAGATGVLVERFDPVETLREIGRHRVTNVIGAPPMYLAWSHVPEAHRAFASTRLAVSGAAPLPAEVLSRFRDVAGQQIFEGYGLTETGPVLTTNLMSTSPKAGSVGRPIPGVELRLLDERGREVDEDDPGEIVVRGANLFSGYWPDGADAPDAQGWFATGDVAYADADGDLHLVDRRTELILVSGFNVYPREVEDVLLRHPEVEECAVMGAAHPSTGETVRALVVLAAGAEVSGEDLIEWCAGSLARFKCPTAVELVTALPHSATGKVSKGRLRELSGA